MRNGVVRSLSLICVLGTLALLLVAGCSQVPKQKSVPTVAVNSSALQPAEFVGNDACAECHASAFQSHKESRHAQTLRPMTATALGEMAPPEGQIPETKMALLKDGDSYVCVRVGYEDKRLPLHLVLGSGKTGMTYIGLLDDTTLFETRMSYFPNTKVWHLTPGQGVMKAGAPGTLAHGAEARQCLQCHAVTLPKTTLKPEPRFQGVGCESCHGAGSSHIAAVRAGQEDIGMERIATWNAQKVNEMCAKCHRGPQEVKNAALTEGMTARFQPLGVMKSECFHKSGKVLSCNTCHDPHTNADNKTQNYETACLRCHSSSGTPKTNPIKVVVNFPRKPCPVNPKSGCIPCHMPKQSVFPGQNIPTQMPDHRIAIYKNAP